MSEKVTAEAFIEGLNGCDIFGTNSSLEEDAGRFVKAQQQAAKTAQLLRLCDEYGVDVVLVERRSDRVYKSTVFPFDAKRSLFCEGKVPDPHFKNNTRPAAWFFAEELNIGAGCGNADQHQIHPNSLIPGVYFKEDGVWYAE